jgi:hypothetical protein
LHSSENDRPKINIVVEGFSDEGAAERIVGTAGFSVGLKLGRQGKGSVLKKLKNYNEAARHQPWFVLVDLDRDYPCVTEARRVWLPQKSDQMCFRIAVPELEAWLLAEPEKIAAFLGVSGALIPRDPEALADPKETLVNLARRSRKREIREGLVPRSGTGASVGPTYASDISSFARDTWDVRAAAKRCPSLDRCLNRLAQLHEAVLGRGF